MSLRSVMILAALILLQLCGCVTTSKSSDPSNALERNHDEMMQRVGGGGGGGGGSM
jgi:hypothetical protein